MKKISFYGLSRSGKSCYIFAMAQALSQGITFPDNQVLTVRTPDPRQMVKLYNSYNSMIESRWPAGNDKSVDYNFNVKIALENLMSFGLTDYRGGLLITNDEDQIEEQDKLFQSYRDSSVLLFFIGADTIKKAINDDPKSNMDILYMNSIYENYLQLTNDSKTPVMIVISKSDMLSSDELVRAKDFVRKRMGALFGEATNITAGITAVSLGRNLTNEDGKLEGDLEIGATLGNIHIPILYSFYCVMAKNLESANNRQISAESSYSDAQNRLNKELNRSAFSRFFVNNESSIRNQINSFSTTIGKEKDKQEKIMDTMAQIKNYLLEGSEVYVNGIKL